MNKISETITVEGMNCGHCVKAVQQALEGVKGVEIESVEIGTARISYDPDEVDRESIVAAIQEGGYTVVQ